MKNDSKIWGIAAAILGMVLLFLFLWFYYLDAPFVPEEEGIEVALGDYVEGGADTYEPSEMPPEVVTPTPPAPATPSSNDMMVQDDDESLALQKQAEEERRRKAAEEAERLAKENEEAEKARLQAEKEAELALAEKNNAANEYTEITPTEDEMPLKYQPIYLFDENDNQILFEEEQPIAETPALSIKDINIIDDSGRTSLMKAAAENNIILMHQLIQAGANVNVKDHDGWTAAMFSVRYDGTDLPLRLLQEKGADLRHVNKYGISILQVAARYNENPSVFALLLKGRLPSETEIRSAFVTAISSGKSPDVLEQFMKLQMPLNQFYFAGMTPLMFAAKNTGSTDVIDFLVKNGAEINIRSKEGKTAFDYACENKRLRHDSVYWALNANGDAQ